MIFKSDLKKLCKVEGLNDVDLRKLPQLYRASVEFVKQLGTPELNHILEHLPDHPEYKYISIDSRTHMLMKDFYPNIPGWHCDDFYRTEETKNQPDLENLTENANCIHYILLMNDVSLTEFLTEDIELPTTREILATGTTKPIYYHYDEMIEKKDPQFVRLEPHTLYSFGPLCFHRGQGATKNGWRYFIRITFSNHYTPMNELRYQTQVYTRERVSW
jgi:hypothetical protein